MDADNAQVTPEQAREQLAASRPRALSSARDRRVHAVGTAVLGLAIGLFMASRNLLSETGLVVVAVVFFVAWMVGLAWVERIARTVPRGARRWSRVGIGGSFVLALAAVLPWLNLQAQSAPNTWPMVLLGALVAAIPSLLAAAVIAGGRK